MEPFLSPEMADIDNNLVLVDGQLVKKSECVKMVVTTSLRNFAARARLDILVKDLPEYLAQQHQLVHADGGYVTPAKVEFTTSLYGLTISQVAAPPDFTLADLLEDAEQILLVKLYFAQDLANEAVGPDPVQPINRSRSGSQQPIQLTLPVDRLAQQQPGSNQQPRARSQEHSNQLLAPQEQPAAAADGLAGMAISVADHPAALATAAAGDQPAAAPDDQPAIALDDQSPPAAAANHQQSAVAGQKFVRNKRLRETGITEGEERAGARERESAPRKSRKQRKGQADSTAEQLHEAQQPATSIDDAYDALAVLPSQSADEPLPDAAAAEHAAVPTAHECNDAGTQDAATAKKLRKEEKKARKRARRAADAAAADPCIAEVVSEADAPASALVQAAEPAVSQGLLDHPSGSKETQNAGAKAEGTAAAGPVSQAVDGVAACSQPTHHGEQQKKKKKQKHSHRRDGAAAAGTSAEPVSDILAADPMPTAPRPLVAADAATAKVAEAATNTAAAAADEGPATFLATDKQSAKDKCAKNLGLGISQDDEAVPAAGTSKPDPAQNQSADAAATFEVVADAVPASFTLHKPARQKKRKSSANDKALLSTPDAGAGTSTGLQAADSAGAAVAIASDPEAAVLMTAGQPVMQKRHRLSHSTGPEDVLAADLTAAPAKSPNLKKKERKSAQAAAADTFPAESLAVAWQAGVPVAEMATAAELQQALAPEGAGDDAGAGDAGAGPSVPGGAGAGEAKPAAEDAATKPPKATKRRKQSNSGVSKADAAALTPLQGTSAAKTTLVKPSCQHEPMEQPAGAASASETSMSSAEEARQAAARARQRLEEAAIIFGPCVRPEPKQPEPTEEESMAGRTSAHAKNGDRKASIKAPNSDGRAAQQALTSSKGNAAVKKHAANLPQEPAATIAAAAQDQADAAAPGLAAKAAVAEAVDGATVPRSSKSAAEKQKRKADQAGTSSKAAAPGQAKTATPGAQMDEKKKKNSKKSKADQDVQQEPPAVQGAADKVITASQRAQSAARPAEKGSPADASQRIKSPTSAGKATDWKTRSRPNTELGGKKALGGTPAVNDSAVGGLAARVAGADALAMMPPIPGPRLTEGTHPMGAANGDPSSSKHGKQRSGNDTLLAQAGGRSQKAGAGLKRQTQAKQVTSETEGANQSELKTSPTSSYSSDDSSSVDSSDSEEEEVGPTQVVLDPEAVTTPGPSATSLSSSDDSSVDSESSAEFQEDVPKTQEVVAGSCMQAFSSFTLDRLVDSLCSQYDPFP
ncbi:TPA: hypothetical protein ACH3X2_000693 [Trebouxia sp. C0005]